MYKSQNLKIPKVNFSSDIFTFYLSHPLSSRKYVREWELGFEKRHPKIALLNPFYDLEGEGREDIKTLDKGGIVKKDDGYNWRLFRRDLIAIAYCRGILGIVDQNSDTSFGSPMEFVYGRMLSSSPKLCVCTNKRLFNHPWINTHFHNVYNSFDKLEKKIESRVAHVRKKWGF